MTLVLEVLCWEVVVEYWKLVDGVEHDFGLGVGVGVVRHLEQMK